MRNALPVVALLAAGLVTASTASAAPAEPASELPRTVSSTTTPVPGELRVPDGQDLVLTARVEQGAQVYTCAGGAWALLEPAAVLRSGGTVVLHTKGPQWISPADGSAVTGTAVASVPVTGAVPQLLLKSTANRGTGLFGSVDYIQRLNTNGGVAPAGQCTEGALQAVPYYAEYRFYEAST
ncbi:hypothetical protein FHX82_005649 [Amycolatopsis bartoniae]|uniref:DUF3455 domain-containing protein n=1 Tax=Amycolatopsis bartoniae TaxID=941986 RepID=A0A8H9MC73_9PSEU|nr:DUF3455 domain-containing protein [Amycolatopsis bartoniae]MBB2938571.1 hypothetical protein [Amycolatopsis bartoniae]TVT08925.1 DUF3455 domain-containing protein [Amycolatopsis bartoniae]GHF70051.1 hypothetical protein GCM10017566_49740 [Amycolatopsis bartoniae]